MTKRVIRPNDIRKKSNRRDKKTKLCYILGNRGRKRKINGNLNRQLKDDDDEFKICIECSLG
jgi:hypothetical protein